IGIFLNQSPDIVLATRAITYSYDGLQRLTNAVEAPGSVYTYTYDLAGNRTSAAVDGTTTTRSYDAANQVIGWSYDNAGNPTTDGTTTFTYNALNRLTQQGTATYTYNGDGALVSQSIGATTTRYAQDLVSPLSQILGDGTSVYLYG